MGVLSWLTSVDWRPDAVTAAGTLAIAFLTLVLSLGTLFLWRATQRLVKGSEDTAERQLRAYISITPKDVINWDSQNRIGVSFDLKNCGNTPGFEILFNYSIDLLPSPLPSDFVFPPSSIQYDMNSALFPQSDVPVRAFLQRDLTKEEVSAVETNIKRVHAWGFMHYRDAFNKQRRTRLSFSFGGPDFTNAMKKIPDVKWNWEHGRGHNQES